METVKTEQKPSYINTNLKNVSREELLKVLKEVSDKNEREHWEMMRDTAIALHNTDFVCLPKKP